MKNFFLATLLGLAAVGLASPLPNDERVIKASAELAQRNTALWASKREAAQAKGDTALWGMKVVKPDKANSEEKREAAQAKGDTALWGAKELKPDNGISEGKREAAQADIE